MTSIIEKRLSLHKQLAKQKRQVNNLNSQVNHLQALANIGTNTCMIAHEINNLLTGLSNYAALALNNPGDRPLTEKALNKAHRNCQRASKIMESILALTNGEKQEKKNTSLLALIEGIFACLCRDFSKDGIIVKINVPEDLTVWAVPIQIQQVLMNLILNARAAMLPGSGILTIKAENSSNAVKIKVADTGRGIQPDDLNHIFEPFFTTTPAEKSKSHPPSSGLGLSFCKNVIDSHDGFISVDSAPAHGAVFTITLPKPPRGNS